MARQKIFTLKEIQLLEGMSTAADYHKPVRIISAGWKAFHNRQPGHSGHPSSTNNRRLKFFGRSTEYFEYISWRHDVTGLIALFYSVSWWISDCVDLVSRRSAFIRRENIPAAALDPVNVRNISATWVQTIKRVLVEGFYCSLQWRAVKHSGLIVVTWLLDVHPGRINIQTK